MKYQKNIEINDKKFLRLTAIERITFNKMLKILTTYSSFDKNHDFKILKYSKTKFLSETTILVDLGYQGIQKIHKNVLLPKRKSKKNPLTKEEKKNNKTISKMRVVIENVFAILKKFRIITEKYRNRRKRFALRFNLMEWQPFCCLLLAA